MDAIKKGVSFFIIFVAGSLFGAHQNFWNAFEIGRQSHLTIWNANPQSPILYAVMKDTSPFARAPVDSILANTLHTLNWGYLQVGITLLLFAGLAFLVWPNEKKITS